MQEKMLLLKADDAYAVSSGVTLHLRCAVAFHSSPMSTAQVLGVAHVVSDPCGLRKHCSCPLLQELQAILKLMNFALVYGCEKALGGGVAGGGVAGARCLAFCHRVQQQWCSAFYATQEHL